MANYFLFLDELKANKIYEMVITNRKQKLTDNSCSFSILEQGYQEYVENVLK